MVAAPACAPERDNRTQRTHADSQTRRLTAFQLRPKPLVRHAAEPQLVALELIAPIAFKKALQLSVVLCLNPLTQPRKRSLVKRHEAGERSMQRGLHVVRRMG